METTEDATMEIKEDDANGRRIRPMQMVRRAIDQRLPWFEACRTGKMDEIKAMLAEKPYDYDLGLAEACRENRIDVIQLLLQHGAADYTRGLNAACQYGHPEAAQLMLDKGASIDHGFAYACRYGQLPMVHFLIQKGADCLNGYVNAGLVNACLGHHMDIVQFMLSKGATNYDKALWAASKGGFMDLAELMLDKGATKVNEAFSAACRSGHAAIARLLLTKGAACIASTLTHACTNGHTEIVRLLLEHKDKIVDFKRHTRSVFRMACRHGYAEVLQLILPLVTLDGPLASQGLGEACSSGNETIFRLMLEKGAEPDWDAFQMACKKGHLHLVRLLIDRGPYYTEDDADDRSTGAFEAAVNGHMDLVHFLVCNGAAILGEQGFQMVCSSGRVDIVKLLLDQGWNHYDIDTGLVAACEEGHLEIATLLLDRELPADYDYTVILAAACHGGSIPIIQLILTKAGKDRDLFYDGFTFSLASESINLEVVQFILSQRIERGCSRPKVWPDFSAINSVLVLLCREFLVDQSRPPLGHVTTDRTLYLIEHGVYPSLFVNSVVKKDIMELVLRFMSDTALTCIPVAVHGLIYQYL